VAKTSKLDTLDSELANRLDELFREDDEPVEAATPKKRRNSPLAELKKIVLSIDWEITPQALESFLDQVRLLKGVYPADKVVVMLLQILGSLGQYIKSSRSKVHPSTFALLNRVFAQLEKIASSPNMPEPAKRKLLQAEMAAYQQLREKISQRQTAASAAAARARPVPVEPPASAAAAVTAQMLAKAIAELKEFIRSEMKALRQQIKKAP
jgi:hypothetical protein